MNHVSSLDGILTAGWVGFALAMMIRKRRVSSTAVDGMVIDQLTVGINTARGLSYRIKKTGLTLPQALAALDQIEAMNDNLVRSFEKYIAAQEGHQ